MLEIRNLCVSVHGKQILRNVNLKIRKGERQIIFGPNASGKTTLAMTLMGIPLYEVNSGKILFEGRDITKLSITERARAGIFVAYQSPPTIRGVRMGPLLALLTKEDPEKLLEKVYLSRDFVARELGVGFSGGEKRRAEIAQAFAAKPKLLILDEIDTGIDVESLKLIGNEIKGFLREEKTTLLAITHYGHVLEYLEPDTAYVMVRGQIACYGRPDIVWEQIAAKGYGWCEECLKNGHVRKLGRE